MHIEDEEGERIAWFKLPAPRQEVELLIKYASPREGEKFRRRMMAQGIMRETKAGREIANGRDRDYLTALCESFVQDWRGVTVKETGKPAPFDAAKLASVMLASGSVFEAVLSAVGREEAFFGSGDGSST